MIYVLPTELSKAGLKKIRRKLEKQNSIFSQKKYLDGLYLPSHIIGRKKQAEELLLHIESLRQGFVVPVISVYGRSGSGKSTLVKFVCNNIDDLACFAFANLRKAKTVFGCANIILSEFGMPSLKSADGINKTVDVLAKCISERLESHGKKFMILVLDEYDAIFSDKRNNPSDFMYKLLTLEEELRQKDLWLCIITISNNALSEYTLDDRIKSRMGNSEVFFPPYTKDDISQILKDRAEKAFTKKIEDKIVQYCAEIGSAEHGDARRALDLLRVAGELCDGTKITIHDIDSANQKLQKDRLELVVTNASYHQKHLIGAICRNLLNDDSGWTATSAIYDRYKSIIQDDVNPLSYRRISDLLVELKNTGLVHSRTISRGRAGYGTEYRLLFSPHMVGPYVGKEWWDRVVSKKLRKDTANALLDRLKPRSRRQSSYNSIFKKYGI